MTAIDPEIGAIMLVDKPITWTSFNVVSKVRMTLQKLCGHRVKVGHAGTLDPLATGLLILGTGKCTKELQRLTDEDKAYTATLRLGQTTPSYDAETDVEVTKPWEHVDGPAIRAAIERFIGPLLQRPPDFSAKRFKGERAYRLARAGAEVELPPAAVTIHEIDIVGRQGADLTIDIRCSKGTYIRSLAHDIGQALGCGAHLVGLRRTASGDFNIEDALTVEQWSQWFDDWLAGGKGSRDARTL